MAFLFADSFDLYSSASDASMRWTATAGSSNSLVSGSSTAFGGQALKLAWVTNAFTICLSQTFSSNEATLFATCRLWVSPGSVSNNVACLIFYDGTNAQVTVNWRGDGTIEVRSGSNGGTLLSSVTGFIQGIWDSYQIKVVINGTTGSVEIRKNGSSSPILSLSNVNTQAGSANSYANKATWATSNSGGASSNSWYLDDVWFNSGSGAAPSSWPGDVRSYQQTPASDVQAQFTVQPVAATIGQNLNNGFPAFTANQIVADGYTASATGTITSLTLSINGGFTGHAQAAIYDATGPSNGPGNLLGTSAVVTNPVTGANTFTFSPSVAVSRGVQYWLATLFDTANNQNVYTGTNNTPRATVTWNYSSSFPASLADKGPTLTTTNPRTFSGAITTVGNWSGVADGIQDGDSSYVASSTVGNEDIYNLSALSNLTGITGVNYYAIWKKTDAGARSGGLQLIANGSADTNIANVSLSPSYTLTSSFQALDPTSASWTQTTINSAQIGVKVTA